MAVAGPGDGEGAVTGRTGQPAPEDSIVSLLCLRCESASRRFQQGEIGAFSMIVKAFYKIHLNIKLYVIIKCDG